MINRGSERFSLFCFTDFTILWAPFVGSPSSSCFASSFASNLHFLLQWQVFVAETSHITLNGPVFEQSLCYAAWPPFSLMLRMCASETE